VCVVVGPDLVAVQARVAAVAAADLTAVPGALVDVLADPVPVSRGHLAADIGEPARLGTSSIVNRGGTGSGRGVRHSTWSSSRSSSSSASPSGRTVTPAPTSTAAPSSSSAASRSPRRLEARRNIFPSTLPPTPDGNTNQPRLAAKRTSTGPTTNLPPALATGSRSADRSRVPATSRCVAEHGSTPAFVRGRVVDRHCYLCPFAVVRGARAGVDIVAAAQRRGSSDRARRRGRNARMGSYPGVGLMVRVDEGVGFVVRDFRVAAAECAFVVTGQLMGGGVWCSAGARRGATARPLGRRRPAGPLRGRAVSLRSWLLLRMLASAWVPSAVWTRADRQLTAGPLDRRWPGVEAHRSS
jgi:hypothetical protein